MQKYCRGAADRKRVGWRRYMYLGQGPAMQVLLTSAATLVAGCNANDSPQTEVAPVALATARAALVTNTVLEVSGDTYIRQAFPNENEGALGTLSVQTSSRHRSLLFFDEAAIRSNVGAGTVQSARIDLFV